MKNRRSFTDDVKDTILASWVALGTYWKKKAGWCQASYIGQLGEADTKKKKKKDSLGNDLSLLQ